MKSGPAIQPIHCLAPSEKSNCPTNAINSHPTTTNATDRAKIYDPTTDKYLLPFCRNIHVRAETFAAIVHGQTDTTTPKTITAKYGTLLFINDSIISI